MNWQNQYESPMPRRSQAPPTAVVLILILMFGSVLFKFVLLRPPKWVEYSDPGARFSVSFPTEPAPENTVDQSALGPYEIHHFDAETHGGRDYFAIFYIDYPPSLLSYTTPDSLLDKAMDGFITAYHGTAVSRVPLSYYNCPGRESVSRIQLGQREAKIWTRAFILQARVYILCYGTRGENIATKDAKRFMNSFRLK